MYQGLTVDCEKKLCHVMVTDTQWTPTLYPNPAETLTIQGTFPFLSH